MLRSQAGKKLNDSACVAAKRNVADWLSATARASSGTRATRARISCAVVQNHSPAAVNVAGCALRSNSTTPA